MEKISDTYQIASDIQWQDAGKGIVRQIMGYDEHLMMVKVKFEQGAVGTLHQHPHTQSTYVASGCFEPNFFSADNNALNSGISIFSVTYIISFNISWSCNAAFCLRSRANNSSSVLISHGGRIVSVICGKERAFTK